jgi:hypothetical protein
MTLFNFYRRLDGHDWFARMSDSNHVYKQGEDREGILREISNQSPEHRALFLAFADHIWCGGPKPNPPLALWFWAITQGV